MLLDLLPQVGDRALCGHAQDLGQCVVRGRADGGRSGADRGQLPQHLVSSLGDHVIDEELGHGRQDDAGESIDQQQRYADQQPAAGAPHQVPGVAKQGLEARAVDFPLFRGLVEHSAIVGYVPRDLWSEWIGICLGKASDQCVRGLFNGSRSTRNDVGEFTLRGDQYLRGAR